MRLLVCAEAYGFGPVSKGISIVKGLRQWCDDIEIIFLGQGTALEFVENNAALFDTIIDGTSTSPAAVLDEVSPTAVVSAMDPYPLLEASVRPDAPLTAFVDSLFWYWVDGVDDSVEEITSLEPAALHDRLDELPFHALQLATHSHTDISYIQGFPSSRRDNSLEECIGNHIETGPIIDTTHEGAEEERLLISLAGMLSPVVSVDDAVTYTSVVLDELSPLLQRFAAAGAEPMIVGNQQVLNRIETDWETGFLPHDQYLEVLASAPVLICPASIMSIYEAVAYEVPVVLLPELSPSHWPDYEGLNAPTEEIPFAGGLFGEHLPEFRNLSDDEIWHVYDALKRYQAGERIKDGAIAATFDDLRQELEVLMTAEARKQRATKQATALRDQLPSTNGTETVVTDFLQRVDRQQRGDESRPVFGGTSGSSVER